MSIETVAVVGCGRMGRGIAVCAASHGFRVVAVKATGGDLEPARASMRSGLERQVHRGKLGADAMEEILGRITLSGDLDSLRQADLVIESGLEDHDAKVALLTAIEAVISEGAILATNTSSLPLLDLAAAVRRPAQLVALHFFNPAEVMNLVEVGVTELSAPGVVAAASVFCTAIGKTPVEVSASPGYVVNRLLVPYLLHAIETLSANVADADAIDTAMRLGCGHPMGPLALADLIGLDVVAAMARTLERELDDPRYRVPRLLQACVDAGELGRKTGLGLFDYSSKDESGRTVACARSRPPVSVEAAE